MQYHKTMNKKILFTIISFIFFTGFVYTALAANSHPGTPVTVPSAPDFGYVLLSTTTGNYMYVATSSLGISGGASLSGGVPNWLTYWINSTTVGATSSPTVGYINATSTATSTFTGPIQVANLRVTSMTQQSRFDWQLRANMYMYWNNTNMTDSSSNFYDRNGNIILDGSNIFYPDHTHSPLADGMDNVYLMGNVWDSTVSSGSNGQFLMSNGSSGTVWTTPTVYGFGTLSSTTPWTLGNLTYVSASGKLSTVATSTLTATSPLSGSFTQIGSGGLLSCPTCNTTNATVSSVAISSPTSTLTVNLSPITTSGTITVDLNLAHSNAWTAGQTFTAATSTNLSVTNFSGAGLTTCNSAGNALTWAGNTFGCNTITTGGGGTSTWSTTNSTVGGELVNYSNNSTDIVTVGSNATSSAKFFFDPNISYGYLASVNTPKLIATAATTTSATTTNFAVTGSATTTYVGGIISPCFATSTAGGCIVPGTGGGASLSGGVNNWLTYWTSATTVGATSSPTVGYIIASSTTATSTFASGIGIGTTTPIGALDVEGGIYSEMASTTAFSYDFSTMNNIQNWSATSTNATISFTNINKVLGKCVEFNVIAPPSGIIGSTTFSSVIWNGGIGPGNSVVNGTTDVFAFCDMATSSNFIAGSLVGTF